ncbi:zinc finger protein 771-like [Branchiostoma floridae]|uniref:Zinc finger protein 771-like n=1 Tax=Branchiostoma floridae TaxID=7739 RepID=A0A9J7LNY1_BRAFL|nr:zinc finger protein 771-like [Branchiostoma floridae]
MGERSGEVAMDDHPAVHPGDETSSSETLDTGRQQNEEENIPCEEKCEVESDRPPAQGRTEQKDRLAVKRTVNKRFACTECGYRAAKKSVLIKHMRKHTECGYSAAIRCRLLEHMRIHTGEKPYKCDQCNYTSATKYNLDQHMTKHTGVKTRMCGECGFRTANRSNLSRHIRTHTGEKPYKCAKPCKCDQCDYSAAQKCHLDQHVAKHNCE